MASQRCPLGFWATSSACWELYSQLNNLDSLVHLVYSGVLGSSNWLNLRELITKELTTI